jgi:hypothetical protein
MPQNAAKSRQIKPPGRVPYIPAPVRKRVLARHISGESNRCIAIKERIDRGTVGRILSQKEVVQKIARYQSRVLDMVPEAIRAVKAALSSPDERIRMQAAAKVLEGTGVLNRGGIEQTLEIANHASSPAHGKERVHRILSDLIAMTIQKHHDYDIPLPEKLTRFLPNGKAALEDF